MVNCVLRGGRGGGNNAIFPVDQDLETISPYLENTWKSPAFCPDQRRKNPVCKFVDIKPVEPVFQALKYELIQYLLQLLEGSLQVPNQAAVKAQIVKALKAMLRDLQLGEQVCSFVVIYFLFQYPQSFITTCMS